MIRSILLYLLSSTYHGYQPVVVTTHSSYFGRVMRQVMQPLELAMNFIDTLAFTAGSIFLFGAIGRYLEYRKNPSQYPLGQAFFLGAIGLVLLMLPWIGYYLFPRKFILY